MWEKGFKERERYIIIIIFQEVNHFSNFWLELILMPCLAGAFYGVVSFRLQNNLSYKINLHLDTLILIFYFKQIAPK